MLSTSELTSIATWTFDDIVESCEQLRSFRSNLVSTDHFLEVRIEPSRPIQSVPASLRCYS